MGLGESFIPAFALAASLLDVVAGLVASVPLLVGAVLQPLTGWGVTRVGSVKRWVIMCAIIQALTFVPLSLSAWFGVASPVFVIAVASLPCMLALQLAVNIAGPFFTPFMLSQLHLPYWSFVLLVSTAFVGRLLSLPFWGRVARARGPGCVAWYGGVGIVLLPLPWVLSDDVVVLVIAQLVAGALWGGYELATLLLVFERIPASERTPVLTAFNLGNALATVTGAWIGASLFELVGRGKMAYMTLFLVSTVLRFATMWLSRGGREESRGREPTLVTRILAVRPSAGAIERPILASQPQVESDQTQPATHLFGDHEATPRAGRSRFAHRRGSR